MPLEDQLVIEPATTDAAPTKNWLERVLSVVGDVQRGEGLGVLLLTVDMFVLLGSYYLLKTVRESLILTEGSAEIRTYSSAGQAILLLGVVPLYGWIATHLNRNLLTRVSTLFFALNLVCFYFLGHAGHHIGIAFYIWVGIFNVFMVAQLWAFATDLFTEEQGKRLFPVIGVGASVGAVAGAWEAGRLIKPLGPYNIMLVSAFLLGFCALLTRLSGYAIVRHQTEDRKKLETETLGPEGGFELILKDRYLTLIAILTILLNIVTLSGDFILGKLVLGHAQEVLGATNAATKAGKALVGNFYASYYEWTNIVSFVMQTFLVSRIFKYVGVRRSLFVLPALSLAAFASILISPVMAVVRDLKIAENGTNYSLQNTIRHALLLPTSREVKYKAKAAIETFCVRLGDVLEALIVFVGTALHFTLRSFALVSLTMTAAWIVVAVALFREHRRRLPDVH